MLVTLERFEIKNQLLRPLRRQERGNLRMQSKEICSVYDFDKSGNHLLQTTHLLPNGQLNFTSKGGRLSCNTGLIARVSTLIFLGGYDLRIACVLPCFMHSTGDTLLQKSQQRQTILCSISNKT